MAVLSNGCLVVHALEAKKGILFQLRLLVIGIFQSKSIQKIHTCRDNERIKLIYYNFFKQYKVFNILYSAENNSKRTQM